ncbi:hypothetical protein PENTCL1PPCAC_16921, partial [Pristionchus entomophagus]
QRDIADFMLLVIFSSGCVICLLALLTIHRSHALHNSFGVICAFQMSSDLGLLLITTIFSFLPAESQPAVDAPISILVGQMAEALYFFSGGLHVLFAFHRLILIVFPTKKFAWTKMTVPAILTVAFISLMRSFIMQMLDSRLFLKYNREVMSWEITVTPSSMFYITYFEIYWSISELVLIISLDSFSLIRLHFQKNKMDGKKSKINGAVEKLLVMQSFAQCVPTGTVVVLYFFVFPNLTDPFAMFIASSFTWNAGNVMDGAIILIFHSRNLFRPKSLT